MRLIDADKLTPDCMTNKGTFAISQSQIANAPTVNPCKDCDLYFKAMTIKTMREAEQNET